MAQNGARPVLPALEIDPAYPGTPIRVALIIEGVLNLVLALPMIFTPHQTALRHLLPDGSPALERISPEAVFMVQGYGVVFLGIIVALALAFSNVPGAVERRRFFYLYAAGFEFLSIIATLWQAWVVGQENMGMDPVKLVRGYGTSFAALVAWRIYALWWKPEWFGRYRPKEEKSD